MTPERTLALLAKAGAMIQGHFVGTNGNHLSLYVAKDRATCLTSIASELCEEFARRFANDEIDAIVAPAVGGIALSQWTAHHLRLMRPDRPEVLALYAEPADEVLYEQQVTPHPFPFTTPSLKTKRLIGGDKIILRRPSFVLKRGFNKSIKGKRVLGIEDVLTTGGSAARTGHAITASEGNLVGFGVLANGGKVTAERIGAPRLEALIDVEREIFTEEECAAHGLCARGIPINTDFGHGAAFLARRGK